MPGGDFCMITRVLLTGAATLLGAETLKELILRPEINAILLLMPLEESTRRRYFERLAAYLGPLPPSLKLVAGDIRLPRFGMSLTAWDDLATSFDEGFHCEQREVKDQNLQLARQTNLRSAEAWIELLERNPKLRLHHVSTAFVAGTRRGLFTEFDLDCGQGFHNAWERSHFETELLLRESSVTDRVTIYRPSHLLGQATTGEAFELGGAYPLVATLAASSVLPGDGRARIDFVPADYVAACMVALAFSGATGTFHLVSGWQASITVRRATTLAAQGRGRSRGARLIPRGVAWPLGVAGASNAGGLVSRGGAFRVAHDLLHQGPVFDTYLADLALEPLGIARKVPEIWLERMVSRAEARHWEQPAALALLGSAPRAAPPIETAEVVSIGQGAAVCVKRFHQVGDVNVAYRDFGQGEPVVFLHGFAGAHAWDGVVDRLLGRRRALVVETLGLSDSNGPASADFGLLAQAARVRGLLSALEIPRAHIVGNDTGSIIAQIFAVRWPHCVKSLVLSDCDIPGNLSSGCLAWMALLTRLPAGDRAMAAMMRVPAVARSRVGFGRMVFDKRVLTRARLTQYLETIAGDRGRRIRLKRFFQSFHETDLVAANQQIRELHMPTMIIWGGDDACRSPSWAKTLYDAIPGARRLELIPFAGAYCHEERPDLFARLLADFFDELGSETERS